MPSRLCAFTPFFVFLKSRTSNRVPFFGFLISIFYYLCFMPGRKQHIIRLIRQKVNEIDNSAEVILYGSRARGDAKKDSDWDILILTNYPVSVEIERSFRNNLFDLEIETGEVFSTFVYQKQDWNTRHNVTPLYHNIKREGVRI